MKDFLEEVSRRLVLGDGDLLAAVEAQETPLPLYLEELNLSNPDAITAAHNQFLSAGAEVLRTNSFHARAKDLAAHGLENRLSEIHWLAAQLAKSAARGTGALVAGSVSQEDHGTPSAYQARVGALLDGGCDLIFFENFTRLDELIMAIHVKQALHHCPAICSLTWNSPVDLVGAFQTLENEGAEAAGGPFKTVFPLLPKHPGLPKVFIFSEGENTSKPSALSHDAFAEMAVNISDSGGGLLLGGAGITAKHIACASEALSNSEQQS